LLVGAHVDFRHGVTELSASNAAYGDQRAIVSILKQQFGVVPCAFI
jgi:hypothetical protein